MKKIPVIVLLSFSLLNVHSQTGGDNIYEFLNLSPNAYSVALGAYNLTLHNNDPAMASVNPALGNKLAGGNLALNYVNYLAGINYGTIMYTHSTDSSGIFTGGINYLNYGRFDRTDDSGNQNGRFSAAEYAFNLVYTREIDSLFSAGINIKPVLSQLESYISLGISFDIGAAYKSRDGRMTAGIAARNIGFQIIRYNESGESLPFEIMAGISTKLKHAPFRFSLTGRHLEKYNLIYDYIGEEKYDYTYIEKIAENIMRHFIFGVEIIPSDNFFAAAGFNYQRRKELAHDTRLSTVGFSLGAGIKTSAVDITISRARYHLAGSSTTFSLILKPSLFNRMK